MRPLNLIVALDEGAGFSKDSTIPWIDTAYGKEDLKYFKRITKNAAVIMGRKTYQEIHEKKGGKTNTLLLQDRSSYVISKTLEVAVGAKQVSSLRQALELIPAGQPIYTIGGEKLFTESFPWVSKMFITLIPEDYHCNKRFSIEYVKKKFKITGVKKGSTGLLWIEYTRAVK